MTGLWTDRIFFGTAVLLVFGTLGDKVPQSFIDDRTKLRGAPFDVKAMTAAVPHHRDQFRAQAAMDRGAARKAGGSFLLGEFSLVDAGCYMNIWHAAPTCLSLPTNCWPHFHGCATGKPESARSATAHVRIFPARPRCKSQRRHRPLTARLFAS